MKEGSRQKPIIINPLQSLVLLHKLIYLPSLIHQLTSPK